MENNISNRILIKTDSSIKKNQTYLTKDEKEYIKQQYFNGKKIIDIAKELYVNKTSILKFLKKENIKVERKNKYKIKEDYFDSLNERNCYFLGLYYSDGNVHSKNNSSKISLLITDDYVLKELSKDIYGFEKVSYDGNMSIFYCYNKNIKNALMKHGCVPNKSFKIRLLKLEDNLMSHFLRGMFDGDGSIYLKRPMVKITTNIDFANDLKEYLSSKNIVSCICNYKKTKAVDLCIYKKNDVLKFLDFIYKKSNNLCINRKYIEYLKLG